MDGTILMKIYITHDYEVTKIEFCCQEMSKNLLLRTINTKHWTDHPLPFFIGKEEHKINFCPYCGAAIDGAVFNE